MTQTMVTREHEISIDHAAVNEHLDRLAAFPDELSELLREQPGDALTFRPLNLDDAWSITETIGHLIVFDARWSNRIRQMLSADEVRFVVMSVDEFVQQFGFQSQNAADLLAGFAARRAERVAFLRGLKGDDLARNGTHPDLGPVSVADAIATLAQNDAHRRRQIEANLEAYQQRRNLKQSIE